LRILYIFENLVDFNDFKIFMILLLILNAIYLRRPAYKRVTYQIYAQKFKFYAVSFMFTYYET